MVAPIITADYRSLERELHRVAGVPDPATLMDLEFGLASAFADVTAKIHVITGALKGSGKTESDIHDDKWEGQMTWGGPSPGFFPKPVPAHPHHEEHPAEDQRARMEVIYAFYEKRRGSEHDFLRSQDHYTQVFREIFERAVKGTR